MEPKPISDEHLPKATHENVLELLGIKVRVYQLDDGRRVIEAEDFHKLIAKMAE